MIRQIIRKKNQWMRRSAAGGDRAWMSDWQVRRHSHAAGDKANRWLVILLVVMSTPTARGELTVADIFSDHMVLQAGIQRVPIWGRGHPGAGVEVRMHDRLVRTTVDTSGGWLVSLGRLEADGKGVTLSVSSGEEHIVFEDVIAGEVWLASGQSNMGWQMKNSGKALPKIKTLLDAANHPLIRYRAVKTREQRERQDRIGDGKGWTVCTPEHAASYSAVAFLFARCLHVELDVPVGIIESAWGGHPIEPFIPRDAFQGHPVLEKIGRLSDVDDLAGVKALEGGVFARNGSWLAGRIYNSRIAPVAPYGVRGAIWYQAESNCGKEEDPRFYTEKMRALVAGWRMAWNMPEMPVHFVQLPQFDSAGWVPMRDQQRRAMQLPGSGMAVTIDLAVDGIHPNNKLDVAERLALWPLKHQYGRRLVESGPLFRAMEVNGKAVEVSFSHLGGGLCTGRKTDLQPTELLEDNNVNGFELCDVRGDWHPAKAIIEGEYVRCTSASVEQPMAVRYGYAAVMPDDAPWNLYNRAGLPASPFISHPEHALYDPAYPTGE